MNKIYIGECEHLENCCITDDKCLKRYIRIYNPKTGYNETLVFCNDYLKLHAEMYRKDYHYNKNQHVTSFIELEILKHLGLEEHRNRYASRVNIILNPFPLIICERPRVYIYVSLYQMIEWYYQNKNTSLLYDIGCKIDFFLNELKATKDLTSNKRIIMLNKRLKKVCSTSIEEKETALIELINDIFKITTKLY